MTVDWKGELRFNEILAPHTSWHIGGPADRYYSPYDLKELQLFLSSLPPTENITWLGLGSNVLIADEGIRGTVIHTLGMKSQIQEVTPTLLRAEAGLPCAKLSKYCAKHNLKGGAFFSGIPGTLGGALAMNAGAFGDETWAHVVKVEVMDRFGTIKTRLKEEYDIGYRSVKLKSDPIEWFVAGYFQFEAMEHAMNDVNGSQTEIASSLDIKKLLQKRNDTQPIGVFSCGSVFKNPPNAYVGKLIEQSNLKGYRVGGAEISTKHANFIINTNNATAQDVLAVMRHIMDTVYTLHNIKLEPEVRMLGFN